MGLVDVDAEVGVLLHHRLGTLGQVRRVLRHRLRVDREQRLLFGERVLPAAVRRDAGLRGRGAGPRRNRPVLVAGTLGAHRRERGLQLSRFVGADAGQRRRGDQRGREYRGQGVQVHGDHGSAPGQKE
jgi:hypothetical protein